MAQKVNVHDGSRERQHIQIIIILAFNVGQSHTHTHTGKRTHRWSQSPQRKES